MVIRRSIILLLLLSSFVFSQSTTISPFDFYNISDSSSSGGGSTPGGGGGIPVTPVDPSTLFTIWTGTVAGVGVTGTTFVNEWRDLATPGVSSGFNSTSFSSVPAVTVTDKDANNLRIGNFIGTGHLTCSSNLYAQMFAAEAVTYNWSLLIAFHPTANSTFTTPLIWYADADFYIRIDLTATGVLRVDAGDNNGHTHQFDIKTFTPTALTNEVIILGLTWELSTKTMTAYTTGEKLTDDFGTFFDGATTRWYLNNFTYPSLFSGSSSSTHYVGQLYELYTIKGLQSEADMNSALAFIAEKYNETWSSTGGSSPVGGSSFTAPDDVFAEADRLFSVEAGELIDSSASTVTAWYSRYDLTDGFTITPTSDPPIAYITDVDDNKLAYPNFSGSHALVTNPSNTFYDSLFTRSAFTILYVCQPTNNSANSVFIQWYKNYDYLFRLEVESDGDLIVEVRDPSSSLINAPIASYPPTTMADSIMVFGLSWDFSTKTFTTYAQGNKTATVMSMFTGAKVNWYDVNETLEMSKDNLSNQTNKTYAFYIYDGVQSDADINTALAYLANKYKAAAWVDAE